MACSVHAISAFSFAARLARSKADICASACTLLLPIAVTEGSPALASGVGKAVALANEHIMSTSAPVGAICLPREGSCTWSLSAVAIAMLRR
eukprot:SAG31_NODE_4691_length_3030_cov_1.452747_3_plen_92_part_00